MRKILSDFDYKSVIDVPRDGVIHKANSTILQQSAIQNLIKDERFREVLIPHDVISKRIKQMAIDIIYDNPEAKKYNVLMVLTGAFMFTSDLCRDIFLQNGQEIILHPMKLSTYASEIKQAGETIREVEIQLDCKDLENQDIIIIEDIVDQGFTLNALKKFLLEKKKVRSVKICTLLDKILDNPSEAVKKNREQLELDYVGFTIPDVWVAGYGIDSGEEFRHLPFLIAVNEKYYL